MLSDIEILETLKNYHFLGHSRIFRVSYPSRLMKSHVFTLLKLFHFSQVRTLSFAKANAYPIMSNLAEFLSKNAAAHLKS